MGRRAPQPAEDPAYKVDQTRQRATTPVAPLTEPISKGYLCQKCCHVLNNQKIPKNILNRPMYQRAVTRAIWEDNREKDQYFRYKGEVGYDMTKKPPAPIMSAKKGEETRPSEFPLSGIAPIRQEYKTVLETAGEVAGDFITREELEKLGGSVLRIPDVAVLKLPPDLLIELNAGTAKISHFIPVQKNLERIVEIKFGNDYLTSYQVSNYLLIAGPAAFNYLEPTNPDPAQGCGCQRQEKKEQKQEQKQTSPSPVTQQPVVPLLPPFMPPRGGKGGRLVVDPQNSGSPDDVQDVSDALPNTQISEVEGAAVVLLTVVLLLAPLGL